MKTLYEMLREYGDSDYYGFHMPGHKRNNRIAGMDAEKLPYKLDITEIEGFDDLHHAWGILKETQEIAAYVYGAEESHFLVNGSTVGILAAVLGCTRRKERILIARNCHKSVYNAIEINELEAEYLYPEYLYKEGINGQICVDELEKKLSQCQDVKAVVIVSPTYDGMVSEVQKIARCVHARGIPLIVDEAHGAHFGFHEIFPENANALSADIVIHSLHKTLPALTQSALLHINGRLVDRERVRRYLSMLQSSSPSYILMAGLDVCVRWLKEGAQEPFERYAKMLRRTRKQLGKLRNLRLIEPKGMELSKILISTKNTDITGRELSRELLERFHLQMEMASIDYVTALTSVGDSEEGMERLCNALEILDRERNWRSKQDQEIMLPRLQRVATISEMDEREKVSVSWEQCEGKVAAEMVYVYPPGIPLIVPGERISRDVIECVNSYRNCGFAIEGTKEDKKIQIERE